jgi:hypothetical protein
MQSLSTYLCIAQVVLTQQCTNRDVNLDSFIAKDKHGAKVDLSAPLNSIPDRIIILEEKGLTSHSFPSKSLS